MDTRSLKNDIKTLERFTEKINEFSSQALDRALEAAISCMQKVIDEQEVDNEY